jgi:hypothetical protein
MSTHEQDKARQVEDLKELLVEESQGQFIKDIESIAQSCGDTIGDMTLKAAVDYCHADEEAFPILAILVEV